MGIFDSFRKKQDTAPQLQFGQVETVEENGQQEVYVFVTNTSQQQLELSSILLALVDGEELLNYTSTFTEKLQPGETIRVEIYVGEPLRALRGGPVQVIYKTTDGATVYGNYEAQVRTGAGSSMITGFTLANSK